MIDVTGINLKKFALKVYQLSKSVDRSKGQESSLSDTMMGVVLKTSGMKNYQRYVLDMHVIRGRACNMTIFESLEGRWFINDTWENHTQAQLGELLEYCCKKISSG